MFSIRSIKYILIFLAYIYSASLQAAGPAMHVFLGQRWLQQFAPQYSDRERQEFLLGTVFPDIRYLGVINRKQSHFRGITLAKVYDAPTPFQRGMLFHSYVDEYRDRYNRRHKIENDVAVIPKTKRDTFIKLVEDQIIHANNDFSKFRNGVIHIPKEEKDFGVDSQSLKEWHLGLALYFTAQPIFLLTQFSLFDQNMFNMEASIVKLMSEQLVIYAQDKAMLDHVEHLLAAFEKEITSQHAFLALRPGSAAQHSS